MLGSDPWPRNAICLQAAKKRIQFLPVYFRATFVAYGVSQAMDPTGAAAASLHHGHSNSGSKPHLQPTPQPMAMSNP